MTISAFTHNCLEQGFSVTLSKINDDLQNIQNIQTMKFRLNHRDTPDVSFGRLTAIKFR